MPFEKGNKAGLATRFRPGMSGNPGGRPYYPSTRADAIREVLSVAEEVLTDPKMIEAWRLNLQRKWVEDPWHVLRALLPFMPKETLTISREIGGALQQMTVSQLRQIVATLPDGEQQYGDLIDADHGGDTEAQSIQAEPEAAPGRTVPERATAASHGDEAVTQSVTTGGELGREWPQIGENMRNSGDSSADKVSGDDELRLV